MQIDLTVGNRHNTLREFVRECNRKDVPMKDCIGAVTAMAAVSAYDEIPDIDKFVGDIYIPIAPASREDIQLVLSACPYCTKKHRHGMGETPKVFGSGDGHRVSHCAPHVDNDRGYDVRQMPGIGDPKQVNTELSVDVLHLEDVPVDDIHRRVFRALTLEFREDFPRIVLIDAEPI